jgi:hypothetical protein
MAAGDKAGDGTALGAERGLEVLEEVALGAEDCRRQRVRQMEVSKERFRREGS